MWSEEYSTPEEDTNSSYVLARCQEVATNTVTALLFASNAKHRWNGKQNNLLFLLLLCKYIHQGLSPISIHYTGCWQWPGFYLPLSDTKVDHIPPEMPSVLAHLWLPSSRHQHGLSAGEIATEVNFQSLIFQHLRFKVFTVYVLLASFPGSPRTHTASDGKLGRAWKQGYAAPGLKVTITLWNIAINSECWMCKYLSLWTTTTMTLKSYDRSQYTP